MILIFLGPPGSGKGTQAKVIMKEQRIPQLATGDMLRAAIQKNTPLGRQAKSFMDRGDLVPDSVVVGLISERIEEEDCSGGFLLDGFPRTVHQAESLNSLLSSKSLTLDKVFLFEVDQAQLVKRLSGRRTCSKCGTVFHVDFNPPKVADTCDSCGAKGLVQRDDDKPEVVLNRLAVYTKQTAPLIGFYEAMGKLTRIDASQEPKKVTAQISAYSRQ